MFELVEDMPEGNRNEGRFVGNKQYFPATRGISQLSKFKSVII